MSSDEPVSGWGSVLTTFLLGERAAEDLEAVALALNNRPRKVLDWKTPAEVFAEQLHSLQRPGVASTD